MAERDSIAGKPQNRTPERRSVVPRATESSREVADEDFLFHLYRGSELLQDNRVLEAKEELENALTLQPRDPKGQDLLAVVYFRIGHYPRAIQIYEELRSINPDDPALKLNLALCYLKTGQAEPARVELAELVRTNPAHKRAWGYLGLACERLGDFAKAEDAFDKGGHAQMARRMEARKRLQMVTPADQVPASRRELDEAAGMIQMREALSIAFEELDAGELSFALALPEVDHENHDSWQSVELGSSGPVSTRPLGIEPPASVHGAPPPPSAGVVISRAEPIEPPPPVSPMPTLLPRTPTMSAPDTKPGVAPPPMGRDEKELDLISAHPAKEYAPESIAKLARDVRLVFPSDHGVEVRSTGIALVRIAKTVEGAPDRSFAARFEAVRSLSGALGTVILERNARDKSNGEAFGGVGSPLVRVSGEGQLVLAPRPSHVLVAFRVEADAAYVREDFLLGFELALSFENGRLGEGDAGHVVHLRGSGAVLLELRGPMASLEITAKEGAIVRRDAIIGWTGRVHPRALSADEAPSGHRGMVGLSGDGTVLIAAS